MRVNYSRWKRRHGAKMASYGGGVLKSLMDMSSSLVRTIPLEASSGICYDEAVQGSQYPASFQKELQVLALSLFPSWDEQHHGAACPDPSLVQQEAACALMALPKPSL